MAYSQLATKVEEIRNSLIIAEMKVMNVSDFVTALQNNGVDNIPVEDIYSNITMLNQTIHSLEGNANTSFKEIQMYYDRAVNRSEALSSIMSTVSQALVTILAANDTTTMANSLTSNFTSIRTNLSSADGTLRSTQQWVYLLSNATVEADSAASGLSDNLTQLGAQLNMINSTLMKLTNLSSMLQISTQQVLLAAEHQLKATRNLSVI